MIPAICINDKNRPTNFPVGKWVKENNKYTISHLWWHPFQKVMAVSLQEINLDNEEPYKTFLLERFAIRQEDVDAFLRLAQECSGLNDEEFLKEMAKLLEGIGEKVTEDREL